LTFYKTKAIRDSVRFSQDLARFNLSTISVSPTILVGYIIADSPSLVQPSMAIIQPSMSFIIIVFSWVMKYPYETISHLKKGRMGVGIRGGESLSMLSLSSKIRFFL